jgi:ribose 5-phosphate isomerase A
MNDKQRVAHHAAKLVQDGMIVGLGTGSTANYFIEALAQRCNRDGLNVKVVASSIVSAIKASGQGLPMLGFEQINRLDVYVDGADEVTADMTLLKGRGADLVREKLLAKAASHFWVLIDQSKKVERIGQNFPIPVEVMPFAWQLVQASLAEIGGQASLRPNPGGDGLAVTSFGSLVLDTVFESCPDSLILNDQLNAIPGIIEHGIFSGLTSVVFCVDADKVHEQWA